MTEELKEQDIRLNKLCFDYHEKEKRITELETRCNELFFQVNEKIAKISELEAQIEKMKQDLDRARENANRQEQWEIYSVLNDIYNDNFEIITSVSN